MPQKIAIMRYITKPGSTESTLREGPARLIAIIWINSSEPLPSNTRMSGGNIHGLDQALAQSRAPGSG